MQNLNELPEIVEDMLKDTMKKVVEIGKEGIIEKVQEAISLCKNREIEVAREAIKKIRYSDLRAMLYLVVAIISREEEDIETLRKAADEQIMRFGKIQTGFLIIIAKLSGEPYDLGRVRDVIEKNDSFSRVQEYLILFRELGFKEDLERARQAARVEVSEMPFFKIAGLTMVAGFTGAVEDLQKMEAALKEVDEQELRRRIPGDVNIDSVLQKSVNFQSACKAVNWIDDEYLMAKVWTLIGLNVSKTFNTVIII